MIKHVFKPSDPEYVEPGSGRYNDFIGCSQMADIIGHGWNSAKDLWLRKTHRAPDQEAKRVFERGHKMEPHMVEMLEDMGRLVKAEQVEFRHPDHPWAVFHCDGLMPKWSPLHTGSSEHHSPGVLELKAPGSHMMDKMMEDGLSAGYITQVQMGMYIASAATGQEFTWATAGALDYDNWELVAFDIKANREFQEATMEKVIAFHECLVNDVPPEPIFPDGLPPLAPVKGTKEIVTSGPLPALVESLIRLQDSPPNIEDFNILNKAIRSEMKVAMGDMQLAEVPGQMRLSYGYGKAKEVVSDPMGLLAYCEYLVREQNIMAAFMSGVDSVHGAPNAITFRRNDWVDLKAPSRTFKPTRIDK